MEKIAGNSSGDGRPSKKRPDPIHSVISNEDLLMEILVRLPILSLLLFKSVSKQWLSLIKSPNFTLRLTRKLDPPCGLFLRNYSMLPSYYRIFKYDFMPLDIRIPSASHFAFGRKAPPGNLEILQSCNGLLLCHLSSCKKLFVYNPSIKCMFKIIPEPTNVTFNLSYIIGGTRMAFDPTKSPHYKVIYGKQISDVVGVCVQIYIYNSETGVWSVCGDRFRFKSFVRFQNGVYLNDAIHWVNRERERGSNFHFKLDILNECPVLTTLKTPLTFDGTGYYECKLVESRGCLLLICRGNYAKELYIYEMNECSEWLVKYIVNLDDITEPLPKMWSIGSNVCYIALGEREDDSSMVMKFSEKVVQYKLVSKALCTLSLGSDNHFNCCFEFIPSFANV